MNRDVIYRCTVDGDGGDEFESMSLNFCFDHEDAALEYCEYIYNVCDGWEWMENDFGKTVISVEDDKGVVKKFTFKLEYNPVFYCYEKEIRHLEDKKEDEDG